MKNTDRNRFHKKQSLCRIYASETSVSYVPHVINALVLPFLSAVDRIPSTAIQLGLFCYLTIAGG